MNLDAIDWGNILVRIVSAIVILLITWIVARVVRSLLTRLLSRISVLNNRSADGSTTAVSLAKIGSLLVWLFGLVAVLNLFQLTSVLTPIQGLLNTVLQYIPNLIGAGLIFFFGLVLARIVRDLTVTALNTIGFDNLISRAGRSTDAAVAEGLGEQSVGQEPKAAAQASAPKSSLTNMIGQILYAIVLVVATIAALQVLAISAISDPATAMLELMLNAIPAIIGAAILLAIGVVVARFAASILESVLRSAGVDTALAKIGVGATNGRDASSIIAMIAQVAIVIFFAVAATRLLGFPEITAMLDAILGLGARILVGALVIAAGVFIANLLAKLVGGQAATVVRYATIVLFIAMGLSFMGLADSIVNLAFGALVIGGATAGALAFGLGGREAAARQLKKMQDKAEVGSKKS